jgi:ribonuclease HI
VKQPTSDDVPDIVVYTDGACSGNPGPGGWAAILAHAETGEIKKLSGAERQTTNNKMELTAVIEALRSIKPTKRWRVRLVSDSQYVIYGLTEWIDGWIAHNWRRGRKPDSPPVKNADLWKTLLALSKQFDMGYEFVRGHSGHAGNEECDRLATAAMNTLRKSDRSE